MGAAARLQALRPKATTVRSPGGREAILARIQALGRASSPDAVHIDGGAREPPAASAERGFAWDRPELYQHIARVCERGLFDTVFFADLNYIADTYTGSIGPALRNATQAPEHDPIPLLSFMAAVTERIGVASTFSVSHSHPFYAARLWATLDHLTRGRAGWNVVTSINSNQAANYGEDRQPTDARYDRAHEFMEVCRRLWESWDEDAVVMDREAAVFNILQP